MKQEDIDKKIGMPDVDAEWAKFEREVISQKNASRKALYWGIGIAASIALVAGIFLFGPDAEKPQQTIAQQTTTTQITSTEEKATEDSIATEVSPKKNVPAIAPINQHYTSELIAEAVLPTKEENVYDCGEVMPQFPGGNRALREFIKSNLRYPNLALEYGVRGRVIMNGKIDSLGQALDFKPFRIHFRYDTLYMNRVPAEQRLALKQQIDSLLGDECVRILSLMPRWKPGSLFGRTVSVRYTLPITFNATDAEREAYLAQMQTPNEELQGRIAGRELKGNYDFLVVVNGQPLSLSEAELKQMLSSDIHVYFYHRQQLVDNYYIYKGEDATRPYVEKYGERAKYGVLEVTTVPDTYCDDYINKHPELKKERHHIEGYVYDEDDQPLADAWVYIRGKGIGAATDSTGYFSLWLPQTDVELKAIHIGYGYDVSSVINTTDTTLTFRLRPARIFREVKATPKLP